MQNELNTNKYFKLAYSANRCRCAVKSGCRERLPLGISVEGNLPVPLRRPSREKSASEGS
ncbi:Hypothetical protein FKW44_023650 [Caligus rogercresseyi]|uniref:Uncharacterized protein n=1 Tax=Caligus rogercresseyi TaxID=217165 RepID=A0A7T8JUW2_CALRO|nr:Hypothetical protein FKW44_023650 [Caligus rogercresseyi]